MDTDSSEEEEKGGVWKRGGGDAEVVADVVAEAVAVSC